MSIPEQESLKAKYYNEAQRYMANARSYLVNAKKHNNFYGDPKYVRTACGVAYSGVLVALDGYSKLKGADLSGSKKLRKSIEFYQNFLGKQDKKLLDVLNEAYKVLHLYGYYDGGQDATIVKRGFDNADAIIEKIRPRA